MDEAKQLINMFVHVIFACAILFAVSGLIYMSQTFTRHFERQEQQSARMQEYAEYSSYDNKNVRGQEIISLIQSHRDDIFILIYNNANKSLSNNVNEDGYREMSSILTGGITTVDDYYESLSTNNTLLAYCGSKNMFTTYDTATVKPDGDCLNVPNTTLNNTQKNRLSNIPWSGMAARNVSGSQNLYDMTDDELIQAFTSKSYVNASNVKIIPNLCGFVKSSPQEAVPGGSSAANLITNPQFEGTYAPFHGNLIYADKDSSEVIGIVFTRLPTIAEEVQ